MTSKQSKIYDTTIYIWKEKVSVQRINWPFQTILIFKKFQNVAFAFHTVTFHKNAHSETIFTVENLFYMRV